MQNPYYIDDLTSFELRDGNGRYSSPSRAKRFYIYHEGQLVYSGEFDRVNISVATKELIVSDAVQEALHLMPRKTLSKKKTKKKQALKKIIDELEEIRFEDTELYKELLRQIAHDDKKLAKDLGEEVYEEFEEDEPLTTPEELYKDLLEVISEEDQLLFEELTGYEAPARGTVSEEYVEYLSYSLGDWRNDDIASAQKFEYLLDAPVVTDSKDPKDITAIFEKNIMRPLKEVYDQTIDGHNLFLFTMLYDMKFSSGDTAASKGWGISRVEAQNWDEFKALVVDELYAQFKSKYRSYLSRAVDNKMVVTGFSLENLYDTESGSF